VFDEDVAPAVGVTPLIEPCAVVELSAREISQMARGEAYGRQGFHMRSRPTTYWRSVITAIKWRVTWNSDWPAPTPDSNNSVKYRLELASKGNGPRFPGNDTQLGSPGIRTISGPL
jgi:hypothetical protein